MSRARCIGLALVILAAAALSAPAQNKLPKRPAIGPLAPIPPRNQNQFNNPPVKINNNAGGFNLNNGGLNPNNGLNLNNAFNPNNFNNPAVNAFNPITGGNGGPAFANSQLNALYQAASPFSNPFSNPFLTPFNNPYPIVNNPYTNGYMRQLYGPYPYSPYNMNPYMSNPFTYPMNNVHTMNPFANTYYNSQYMNPYLNPYANPFVPPLGDNPLANPFLPNQFYQNLLQNPVPFNQFNQ